mmetsp:Transcript_13094/g.28693  ORF Transcript_13094/g.28693 Transcript_13094/m.28693 type:complete len:222 (+) Transcript_13094:1144-1809(+)
MPSFSPAEDVIFSAVTALAIAFGGLSSFFIVKVTPDVTAVGAAAAAAAAERSGMEGKVAAAAAAAAAASTAAAVAAASSPTVVAGVTTAPAAGVACGTAIVFALVVGEGCFLVGALRARAEAGALRLGEGGSAEVDAERFLLTAAVPVSAAAVVVVDDGLTSAAVPPCSVAAAAVVASLSGLPPCGCIRLPRSLNEVDGRNAPSPSSMAAAAAATWAPGCS